MNIIAVWQRFTVVISRPKGFGYISAGIVLFLSSFASAENTNASGGRTIRFDEAISQTLERNPSLRAFGYALQAQEGRVQQAGWGPNPEISLTVEDALGSGEFSSFGGAQTTLSIGWVLERGVQDRRLDVARAGSLTLAVEADVKRLDAAAETARQYIASLSFQARQANANERVKFANAIVRAVQKRVDAGKTPEAELSRAEAELAQAELELEAIELEIELAYRQLAAQWGDSTPDFSRVEGNILQLSDTAPFTVLKTRLEQNPDVALLLSDQRLKEAELRLAKAQNKASWRVSAGVRHLEATDDQAFVAGISIPFGQRRRNNGRIVEAQAKFSQAQEHAKAVRLRIETSLFVFYQQLQQSLHRANALRTKIIPRLEKALQETQRAYNLGRYSYLDWRTVQADLLEARSALIETSMQAHNGVIEIERLTGARLVQTATAQ